MRLRIPCLVASAAVLLGGTSIAVPPDLRSPSAMKLDARLRTELRADALIRGARIVSVFVKTRAVASTRSAAEALGGKVGTVAGDILTVRLPARAVLALAAEPDVIAVEGARPVKKRLDLARESTFVDDVHAGTSPLPAAFQGEGVVVGVVDYGLDLTHRAFRDDADASRVIALWDHSVEGTPPTGYAYGHECTGAAIAGGTCNQVTPDNMHGTHVTGIAAGGFIENSPYTGVAPRADIVFVEVGSAPGIDDPFDALTTAICDAAAYIFKVADAAGKPAVINMSLGEHSGPHDGSSLADQCLDNLTGPGKIIVAAAGNEGNGAWHPGAEEMVRLHASGVATAEVQFMELLLGTGTEQDIFIWTEGDVTLSIQIGAIDDEGNPVLSEAFNTSTQLEPASLQVGDAALGPVLGGGDQIPGGPRGYLVRVSDENEDKAEQGRAWLLAVSGDGRFDAFLDTTQGGGFRSGQPEGISTDNGMSIGFPAVAKQVIAVASYVSKNAWTSAGGDEHAQLDIDEKQVALGALSAFSSRGPARTVNVGVKPDIAAPGEAIVSALHSGVTVDASAIVVDGPSGFTITQGTSMASPHVAGVVALMLEADPQLTVDDIRQVFDDTARVPDGATLPDSDWGRGMVDAFAAVLAVAGSAPVADEDVVEPGPEEDDVEPGPEEEPEPEPELEPEDDEPDLEPEQDGPELEPEEDGPDAEGDTNPGPQPEPEPAAEQVAEPAAEAAAEASDDEEDDGCAGGGSPLAGGLIVLFAVLAWRRRAAHVVA